MQDLKLIYKNAILIHSKNFCKGTACQEGKLTKEEWCQGKTCNFHSKGIEGGKKEPYFYSDLSSLQTEKPHFSPFSKEHFCLFLNTQKFSILCVAHFAAQDDGCYCLGMLIKVTTFSVNLSKRFLWLPHSCGLSLCLGCRDNVWAALSRICSHSCHNGWL